jgi:hypothetical protein
MIPPAWVIRDEPGLYAMLRNLQASVGLTRALQAAALPWATQFSSEKIGPRLKAFYDVVSQGGTP